LNLVSDRLSHLTGRRRKKNYQHSVCGGCYTTLSYDVIYDVFVLFTFAKIEVIWFDTLVSDQSLAILRILHINQVSGQTFGLRFKFEALVSVKDGDALCTVVSMIAAWRSG